MSSDGLRRSASEPEVHVASICRIAETDESITEPMRTRRAVYGCDDVLIKGTQLAKIPLDRNVPVVTETLIGPGASDR
jgi:hypothetical protein